MYAARSGDIPAGSANGNTLRWNGTTWISDNAVFNNGVNVGIGTPSPAAKLDVAGTVKIADGTQGAGKVLTSNASGVASWQAASGGATYRWVSFHSYDPNFGFYFGNDLNMFGGVTPANWTDGNALASQISPNKDIQRTFFQKKGYAKENALIYSDQFITNTSVDGQMVALLFRISNSTGAAINWTPFFQYSAYTVWEKKQVLL
ncbi:MAG: hypothetical protein IPJ66_20775 [Bacteroidetes bacterium]|nr:hypothetical protein [Bacteroidota bacterium]